MNVDLIVGFPVTHGGLIGEPTHEIVVEPNEEPVPMTVPAPVDDPVQLEQPAAA